MTKQLRALSLATVLALTVGANAQTANTPIRLTFTDTPVASVLRALSNETGVSVVVSLKEKYPITIDVLVDSVDDAFRAVASAAGLEYRKVGRTFVISSRDGMKQALEPYSSRVRFTLPPGAADKLVDPIAKAFPYSTVQAQGNVLVFTGIPEDIQSVARFIADADKKGQTEVVATEVVHIGSGKASDVAKAVQAMFPGVTANAIDPEGLQGGTISLFGPESLVQKAKTTIARFAIVVDEAPSLGGEVFEVYELKYTGAKSAIGFLTEAFPDVRAFTAPESFEPPRASFNPVGSQIGALLGSGGGGGGSATGGSAQPQQTPVASVGAASVPDARSKRIVVRGPKQRVSEAIKLLEKLDVEPLQVMVEVNVIESSPQFQEQIGLNYNWSPFQFFEVPPGTGVDTGSFSSMNSTRPLGLGQWSRFPWNINAILNAQVSKGEAKILANPRVQVMDNSGASIFIGDTIRARVAQSGALGSQTIEIREFPVGIILLINPRVNADGNITMHVNPIVSNVTSVDADNVPQTATREAETVVMVKDGETMVLGGLIRDEYSKTVTEVPFLSALPIVGELFKNRSTKKNRTDVIVTITPHIIRPSAKEN